MESFGDLGGGLLEVISAFTQVHASGRAFVYTLALRARREITLWIFRVDDRDLDVDTLQPRAAKGGLYAWVETWV